MWFYLQKFVIRLRSKRLLILSALFLLKSKIKRKKRKRIFGFLGVLTFFLPPFSSFGISLNLFIDHIKTHTNTVQ